MTWRNDVLASLADVPKRRMVRMRTCAIWIACMLACAGIHSGHRTDDASVPLIHSYVEPRLYNVFGDTVTFSVTIVNPYDHPIGFWKYLGHGDGVYFHLLDEHGQQIWMYNPDVVYAGGPVFPVSMIGPTDSTTYTYTYPFAEWAGVGMWATTELGYDTILAGERRVLINVNCRLRSNVRRLVNERKASPDTLLPLEWYPDTVLRWISEPITIVVDTLKDL